MSHRHPLPRWLVAVAAFALLGACTGSDAGTDAGPGTADRTTQSSDPSTTLPSDGPTDLMQVPEDTPLEPGAYSVGLLFDDGSTRAVVDVPEGFVGHGAVIGSDDGDVAFWGRVTKVDTDPCLGGKRVPAGTSVRDLATALVAQRHMRTTRPVPVTIGGYHGLYLKLTAPADLHRCRGGSVTVLTAGGTWLESGVPSGTFHEWILDVHGTRVVGGARISPDAEDAGGLIHIVESAEFTPADRP
jgi:hypothetical protein